MYGNGVPSIGIVNKHRDLERTVCATTRANASPVGMGDQQVMRPNSRLVASGIFESTEQLGFGCLGGIGSSEHVVGFVQSRALEDNA
eukprot:5647958-Amphidinium_carterae.3